MMAAKKAHAGFFSDRDARDAGRFILLIFVFFFASMFLLSQVPLEWAEFFYAFITLQVLNFAGFSGEIIMGEPVLLQLDYLLVPIGFSYLCTGLLETAFVWSAVLASHGIGWKKRLAGAAAGTIAIVVFNIVRILASIFAVLFLSFDAANFSHDIFFRVFLFLTIAGFYFAWFKWATKKRGEKLWGFLP